MTILDTKLSCLVIACCLDEVLKISYKDHASAMLRRTLQLGAPPGTSGTHIPKENGVQSTMISYSNVVIPLLFPRGITNNEVSGI